MKQSINRVSGLSSHQKHKALFLSAHSRRHKQDTEVACGLWAASSQCVLAVTDGTKYGNEGSREAIT